VSIKFHLKRFHISRCTREIVLHIMHEIPFAKLQAVHHLRCWLYVYALVKLVPFLSNLASLILALKRMVGIIETYCLREIFCPILSSTRITSHFSRMEPQRIGLAKLLKSWKSRRQTSFNQICGHPTAPISTQWTTRSGAYCKNGFTRQAVRMSTSYEDWGLGQAWPAHNW